MILDTLNDVNILILHTQLFDNDKIYLKTKFINVNIKLFEFWKGGYSKYIIFILCHEINGKIIKIYTYNIFHFIKGHMTQKIIFSILFDLVIK
jgi:hypothetical protein